MRVSVSPRRKNAPRPAWKVATAYLQWLRGRQCLVFNANCEGRTEAAHVDHAGGKGMGTKAADCHAIPLCTFHHRQQHTRGWRTFQNDHRFDAVKAAAEFWRRWPGRAKWESEHE